MKGIKTYGSVRHFRKGGAWFAWLAAFLVVSYAAPPERGVVDPLGETQSSLLVYEMYLEGSDGQPELAFKIEEVARKSSYSIFLVHFVHGDLGAIGPGIRMMEQAGLVAQQRGVPYYAFVNVWQGHESMVVIKVGYFDSADADLPSLYEREMEDVSSLGQVLLSSEVDELTKLLDVPASQGE